MRPQPNCDRTALTFSWYVAIGVVLLHSMNHSARFRVTSAGLLREDLLVGNRRGLVVDLRVRAHRPALGADQRHEPNVAQIFLGERSLPRPRDANEALVVGIAVR